MPADVIYIQRDSMRSRDAIHGRQQVTVTWNIHTNDEAALLDPVSIQAFAHQATPGGQIQEALPAIYSSYNDLIGVPTPNFGIYLLSIDMVRPHGERKKTNWLATGTYQTLASGAGGGAGGSTTRGGNVLTSEDMVTDPLMRPGKYWIEFENRQRPIESGENKQPIYGVPEGGGPAAFAIRTTGTEGPIVNTAGQPYDTAIYDDSAEVILVVQQNVDSPTKAIEIHQKYDRTLNSDAYTIFGKTYAIEHCKFMGVQISQVIEENNRKYYSMESRIALADSIWETEIVNRGQKAFMELDNGDFDLLPVWRTATINGKEREVWPSEPSLLDAEGYLLPPDTPGTTVKYRTRKLVTYSTGTPNLLPFVPT